MVVTMDRIKQIVAQRLAAARALIADYNEKSEAP